MLQPAGRLLRWLVQGGARPSGTPCKATATLVVYTAAGKSLWGSGTDGLGDSSLVMQSDGNLVIYAGYPTWARYGGALYFKLAPNTTLTANQWRFSLDRRFRFIMQGDGNLVLTNDLLGVLDVGASAADVVFRSRLHGMFEVACTAPDGLAETTRPAVTGTTWKQRGTPPAASPAAASRPKTNPRPFSSGFSGSVPPRRIGRGGLPGKSAVAASARCGPAGALSVGAAS